ncbi:MAG: S-layer homology domain-containing protein, partial [Oscillospiraceae bacterium]|nr:S-layer homology domain-containing protein [Oscillospiraceae bacterium]
MMKKSIKAGLVSTTLAASLLLSTTGVFAFTDVDSGHWAANDIAKLSGSGYINGYEDGTFAPDSFITRAEFVTIINKVMGVTARTYKVYPDVSTDAWYAEQIDIASTAGYINGYDDGTIKPDAPISRAEVAVVCYKAWGLTPEGNVGFTDSSSIGSWAKVQIATLAAKNILSGYEDGSFRPGDAIKRAEVAKIISRLLDMKSGNTVTSVTQQGIGTPAGLANTSVIIKGGNSSSGSSSGSSSSSSSSNTKPSSSQKK